MYVSVPFSMGTVLHRLTQRTRLYYQICFSPLLDGDGVASTLFGLLAESTLKFQSPSRWGRCCIVNGVVYLSGIPFGFSPLLDGDGVASFTTGKSGLFFPLVSVPFSMGTVLHLPRD